MRVLVIGPSWIGDMVMAQSLFRCLHSQHSELAIDVLALDWTRDLLARMPEVNQAISMPVGHGELALGKRLQLARLLRRQDYQQAIVLPNSFKSALIPFFAKIPVRTGWRGEARSWLLNDCRILDERVYPLMVQRFAALGFPANSVLPEPLPVPLLEVSADVSALLEKFTLDTRRPVVVFCPGAEFGVAKQWPEEHFAKVADVTSIGEAIDLMSLADIVLSNDSGLMHIAAALNKPLIVLYGSTSPKFTPPLTDKVKILSLNLACSPCFKRECPLGHLDCLRKLLPATVIEAMNLLESELQGRKPTESGN